MVSGTENPLVFAVTNKAVENVKEKLRTFGIEKATGSKICFTFDSYFCKWDEWNLDSLKDKTLFLEEFSMIPNKWMTKLYRAFTMLKNIYL